MTLTPPRCEYCAGQGETFHERPCSYCLGSGLAPCQRCKGNIDDCDGDDCDGTGAFQEHWAAPEAPPPVEARQPHNPWRASIENILTGDNYFRAAEWHELLADLDRLYAMPPAVKPLDDPRLQRAFGDAIEGALAFGYQQNNKPPVGHWLNRFWNIGNAEAEKASKPPIVTDEMVTTYLKANDEYWRKVDEIAPPIGVWRNGTPREATRESLRAALAAPAGAIQPQKCQICKGVIENCTGDDCDGTGEFQAHLVGAPVTLSDAASEKEKQA